MNLSLLAAVAFLTAYGASAEILVLSKGQSLPKNAKPSGLRKSFVQIEEGSEWLNTSQGAIDREFTAWRDKNGRFTIGWDMENGRIVKAYYFEGRPGWKRGKMVPLKWPADGSISIDLQTGQLLKKQAGKLK